jgi:hypothetical protein
MLSRDKIIGLRPLMKDAVTLYLQARLSRWQIAKLFQNINIANTLALIGAVLYVITLLMQTIVPLRIFGIVGDMFFIGYGVLANSVTTFFLYLLLLPINSVRLYQMLKLVKKARVSAQERSVDELARAVHESAQVSRG